MIEIRELLVHEVPQMTVLAIEFWEEGFLPGELIPEVFEDNWFNWMSSGMGFVSAGWDDDVLVGAAGGLIAPDATDGKVVANEMFWFVSQKHRRGSLGLRVLEEFEAVAKSRGARRVSMVHLANDVGARLAKTFVRWGYRPIETHYIKEIL